MRRFHLNRIEDHTGVSGKGIIAEGVRWTDGSVVLRWFGPTPSTILYERMTDVLKVHGHNGKTIVLWRDE